MLRSVLSRSILLFLITTCVAISIQNSRADKDTTTNQIKTNVRSSHPKARVERGLFFHKKKSPGIFGLIAGLIFEQWNDTKNTIQGVNKLVNDNFLPENNSKIEVTTTMSSDPNVTTTEAPFKITRTEFNRILRRNIKGLIRLFNIELRDAMRQTKHTDREFRKNASLEVSKYLYTRPQN